MNILVSKDRFTQNQTLTKRNICITVDSSFLVVWNSIIVLGKYGKAVLYMIGGPLLNAKRVNGGST